MEIDLKTTLKKRKASLTQLSNLYNYSKKKH